MASLSRSARIYFILGQEEGNRHRGAKERKNYPRENRGKYYRGQAGECAIHTANVYGLMSMTVAATVDVSEFHEYVLTTVVFRVEPDGMYRTQFIFYMTEISTTNGLMASIVGVHKAPRARCFNGNPGMRDNRFVRLKEKKDWWLEACRTWEPTRYEDDLPPDKDGWRDYYKKPTL